MYPDQGFVFQERYKRGQKLSAHQNIQRRENRKSKKTQITKNGKMAPKAKSREAIVASLTKYFKHDSFKSDLQRRAVEAVVHGESGQQVYFVKPIVN